LFFGFDAALVGDTGPNSLSQLAVHLFFPLARIKGDTPIKACPGRTLGQVIPPYPLGKLFDDPMGFEVELCDQFAFLVRLKGDGGTAVPKRNPAGMLLYEVYGIDNDIVQQTFFFRESRSSPSTGNVPWRAFVMACCKCVQGQWVPDMSLRPGSGRTHAMTQFLESLNGRVPAIYDDFVFWMTLYQFQLGFKTGFQDKVRKAYDDLYATLHPKATPP
jgi:hypothetical protein